MSDETPDLIESVFIEKLGVKYPFIRSGGVNEKYGIRFFPSVYCIAPDGKILTVPNDRMPSEDFIVQQLKNVDLVPKMPEDSRFDVLRSMWAKNDYKRLGDYLGKMLAEEQLDADLRTVYSEQQALLDKRIERKLQRIEDLKAGPDYYAAQVSLQKIEEEWKGLPPGDAATAALKKFDDDPKIAEEVKAGKALERLISRLDPNKSSQRRKLVQELMKFAKKYSGTYAAARADKVRTSLAE